MSQRRFLYRVIAVLVFIVNFPWFLWRSSYYPKLETVRVPVTTKTSVFSSHLLPDDSIRNGSTTTIGDETNRNHNWVNADCLQPLRNPILGVHDESRILNVGFPKMGSSSLQNLFLKSGYYSRHHHCGKVGYCGDCIQQEIRNKLDPLEMCGNFTVQTQMDFHPPSRPIYPQIHYLQELYNVAPNATYILPFRNVSKWVYSLTNWNAYGRTSNYRGRFNNAVFPQLNWTKEMGKHDSDYEILVCNHVRNIRKFVSERPTLSLVEIDIEDPNTGEYLESIFRSVNGSFWQQTNVNKKIHR